MALTLESSRHILCAVTCKLRTAHGMCLLLCGQSECHWALAAGFLVGKEPAASAVPLTECQSECHWADATPLGNLWLFVPREVEPDFSLRNEQRIA